MITLASCVTLTRMILTPVVVYYIYLQQWYAGGVIFLIAASTDLLDGFIARKFNQQTNFGQLLDPIADKCLIVATLYSLLVFVANNFWHWSAVWFLLIKELVLLVGGAWLVWSYDFFIKPSNLSRAASLAEIVLILFLLVSLIFFGYVSATLFSIFLSFNLFLSVWLLVRYAIIIFKLN